MRSKKLDTVHLAYQLETILNEDGIFPDKLVYLSGISKITIYSIINRERPTTRRDVARRIAEAIGRKFYIEEDKIFYEKPEELAAENPSFIIDSKLFDQFKDLLSSYSKAEKIAIETFYETSLPTLQLL